MSIPKEQAQSARFPEHLRAARTRRALTQAALATKMGVPQSSLSHFEAGARQPSFANLQRLVQALDVSADYLMGRASEGGICTGSSPIDQDMQQLTDDDRMLATAFVAMLVTRRHTRENTQGNSHDGP